MERPREVTNQLCFATEPHFDNPMGTLNDDEIDAVFLQFWTLIRKLNEESLSIVQEIVTLIRLDNATVILHHVYLRLPPQHPFKEISRQSYFLVCYHLPHLEDVLLSPLFLTLLAVRTTRSINSASSAIGVMMAARRWALSHFRRDFPQSLEPVSRCRRPTVFSEHSSPRTCSVGATA